MAYPFWDARIGYGPLMALIAVVYVFVSHFAIGGVSIWSSRSARPGRYWRHIPSIYSRDPASISRL
jgi:hypothetical protein